MRSRGRKREWRLLVEDGSFEKEGPEEEEEGAGKKAVVGKEVMRMMGPLKVVVMIRMKMMK